MIYNVGTERNSHSLQKPDFYQQTEICRSVFWLRKALYKELTHRHQPSGRSPDVRIVRTFWSACANFPASAAVKELVLTEKFTGQTRVFR